MVLAEPANQNLCHACSVSSDTVQISTDPSLLNKHDCGDQKIDAAPAASLPGQDMRGLRVMGGNHFPCLLNKTVKLHYELASGAAFACISSREILGSLVAFDDFKIKELCSGVFEKPVEMLRLTVTRRERTRVSLTDLRDASSVFVKISRCFLKCQR